MARPNLRSEFLELDNTKSGCISGTEMATLKWPSISERRSPTETISSHIDLDRTRMPTYGTTELTMRINRNWATQSRATSLGTEMATLELPSISERRSPTETISSHIDLDRTRMPSYGKIELTIRIPRTGQHKVGLHLWGHRWLL